MIIKTLVIIVSLGAISAIHLGFTGGQNGFHILHQQLFYIPLVLTSFWFGRWPGLLVAVIISTIYGPKMISQHSMEEMHMLVYAQIALYFFVAFAMGWLSDRQRKQQSELLVSERITALGKAASALSFEIRDIVGGLEKIHRISGGLKNDSANDEFLSEVVRLQRLIEALGRFAPSLDHLALSTDLNNILQHSFSKFRQEAFRKGVKLVLEADEETCPSMILQESITRIYDSLVSNAIDFSGRGDSILLRSVRGAENCILEVRDSGVGVSSEHESKLFTVFFTTKSDGYGISLSSGRKQLRSVGGDLAYEAGKHGGAIFRMIVPRENKEESIEDFTDHSLIEIN